MPTPQSRAYVRLSCSRYEMGHTRPSVRQRREVRRHPLEKGQMARNRVHIAHRGGRDERPIWTCSHATHRVRGTQSRHGRIRLSRLAPRPQQGCQLPRPLHGGHIASGHLHGWRPSTLLSTPHRQLDQAQEQARRRVQVREPWRARAQTVQPDGLQTHPQTCLQTGWLHLPRAR